MQVRLSRQTRHHALEYRATGALRTADGRRRGNTLGNLKGTMMLTIFGKPHRNGGFCDGVTPPRLPDRRRHAGRRRPGAAATCWPPRRSPASSSSHKAIINVFLPGGPPHLDMWDLKPDAPAEIRGEFKPIKTNVPGIRHLRALPAHGQDDGQVRLHPLAGRLQRRPRRLPVHDRPQARPAAGRLLAGAGRLGVEGAGAGQPGRPAAPVADVPAPASGAGAIPATAASSAWPTPRSASSAARART